MTREERKRAAEHNHTCPRCGARKMDPCRTMDPEHNVMRHPHDQRVRLVREAGPATGTSPEAYAASAVAVLREHFGDLTDPVIASVVTGAIRRQAADPQDNFLVIVDDPAAARWRLYPHPDDPRRVRLACFRNRPSKSDDELERTVNDALWALEPAS